MRRPPTSRRPARLDDVSVHIDLASIRQSKSGSIMGRIAFRFGDLWFPEVDWSDFPVVILEWWLSALDGGGQELLFMDGPFSVILDRAARAARLIWGEVPGTAVHVDFDELLRSVQRAARSAIKRCDELAVTGPDVEALRQRIATSETIRA